MWTLTSSPTIVSPTLPDLKQRLADLGARLTQTERAVLGDVDPAWAAWSRLVTADLDAAEEALTQADLARTGGDRARAQRRLAVAQARLQDATSRVAEWETEHDG